LDFDHILGKIPEEDYPAQRTLLMGRGAKILHELDGWKSQPLGLSPEARLEDAVAQRRSVARAGFEKRQPQSPDDELEALLADRRRNRKEKAAGFCPQCGNPVQLSDQFCSKCGNSLVLEEEQVD
jgi:hypothetical protein